MRKLRMGIIGVGMAFEKLHYPAYQMLSDKYEIAAISDLDPQKTEKWKDILQLQDQDIYTDFRQMPERSDIDAFDILVPIELNFEVTREVARAGKPIICEKPLAPNLEEACRARDIQKQYGIPVMIAENYRYNEEVNIIKDLVEIKKVGDICYFIWNRFINFPQEMTTAKFAAREWRQHSEFPGGVILDTGVHDIAALRHIFGDAQKVQSFGKPQKEDFAPYSVMMTNMVFKNGILGSYTFYCSGKETVKPFTGLRIFGTGGMIYLEERDSGKIEVIYNDGKIESLSYKPQRGYYNELLNFYNALMGVEEIKVTPEVEYGDAVMMFTMLKSAREERTLQVDELQYELPVYALS